VRRGTSGSLALCRGCRQTGGDAETERVFVWHACCNAGAAPAARRRTPAAGRQGPATGRQRAGNEALWQRPRKERTKKHILHSRTQRNSWLKLRLHTCMRMVMLRAHIKREVRWFRRFCALCVSVIFTRPLAGGRGRCRLSLWQRPARTGKNRQEPEMAHTLAHVQVGL